MSDDHEHHIRERAYHLWEKEGSPDGRDHEFWERARLMHEAESKAQSDVGTAGGGVHDEVDETMDASFPASDPPSFTPPSGARQS